LKISPTNVAGSENESDEVLRPEMDDDNLRARLVYATYFVVAKSGYHEATVSRIARRADCSPGAIYKLYRSKQDLVLDSFRAIFGSTSAASAPLSHGNDLAELLATNPRRQTGRRMFFSMETTIAAAHNDTLRATVGTYLADPWRLLQGIAEVDEAQTSRLGEFIHCLSALTQGMQWTSAVMMDEVAPFEEFSENFQLALLNEWTSIG
jgi:AcrR family transcriptional regulator